mgnify:CR=1 FL=1
MKKILSLLLTLCLLLGLLPTQAAAYLGDIRQVNSETVTAKTLSSGSLELRNDYLRVIARKDGTLSTAPTAADADPTDRQTPFCYFVTYGSRHTKHPASLRLKSIQFVDRTPNGNAKAIRADYDLTVDLKRLTVNGTTSAYYELVQLKENESSAGSWGVLVSVDNIRINAQDSESFFQTMNTDVGVFWGYTIDGFTGMGHTNAADSPVIKMNHTVYDSDTKTVLSTENSVITGRLEDIRTWTPFSQGGNWCTDYITEVYVDGYTWANPFVGLSEYYKRSPIKAYLPDMVSVTPASRPGDTRVECENDLGLIFGGSASYPNSSRFLWGFRNLVQKAADVPTKPDAVDPTIYAKRLAAFANGEGVTVEYVADDAALEALKKQYGNPVAIINGDYESKNGAEFVFTGGAAMLSPSVTATWNKDNKNNKLIIHKDGRVEQQGVHLNAPSFKFYQPKNGAENDLKINLTKDGFTFTIDPGKNDAIIFVDIPYATVKLEKATADASGNLVFGGDIGFKTIFEGAEFSMEKLGYGLNEKREFKVNGVKAKGSFDTAKLMALELAEVSGEVNTFKGEERYAFELKLNAFDLFETEATLALERGKDGSLIPDELWFYVKANPGIPLIPPIPIGQLNGGGAGFKDLAKTVNGNYFAIPPLKLRGALTGTYLHLIEGTGNVVLGPSEISLKATDVGLVGVGKAGQVIDSFGYTLMLNGQERTYGGQIYKGIYFGGSEELKLNLPNKTLNVIVLGSSVTLGAFGGANANMDTVYLGVGANGVVNGRVQFPSDTPIIGGVGIDVGNINLVIGGQTTFPITGVSVSEGMKRAFNNIDIYLGAMVGVDIKIIDARAWVLIPNIINTNFTRGGGWDVEHRWVKKLPEWNWGDHGVTPLVQAVSLADGGEDLPMLMALEPVSLEDGGEDDLMLMALEPAALRNGGGKTANFTVTADQGETPYIVLAFDNSVADTDIQSALSVAKDGSNISIHWIGNGDNIDPNKAINATIVADMKKDPDDGKEYRMVILRLKEGGSYSVSTNELNFSDEECFTVEPFESLTLMKSGYTLSGEVKYPAENTAYVLRTYLGTEPGGADYLVDEREVENPADISVNILSTGALAPTGEYYVTSFLMTEKTFNMEDGTKKTALVGIDSKQFSDKVAYTNTNEPLAPQSVALTFTGNEVMRAQWQSVENADGYAVTIYRQDGNDWVDTGFGYDLDENTTSIDMALTVGGKGTAESPNLSANQTYKVGVRAYKTIEGGKYYSAETRSDSNGVFLPEYVPLEIALAVNGVDCAKDEKDEYDVFHAYVGGSQSNMLAVRCDTAGVTYNVTRMDTDTPLTVVDGEYQIPDFSGTLMLKIDGISGLDVTSVFLLVSRDETPPVLTLSDPVFYADRDSGKYTVTGTADAGSQILYGNGESTYAGNDGSFTIDGTLESENVAILSLSAQDGAGNTSTPQRAMVVRQVEKPSAPSGGSYVPAYPVETPDKTENGTITVSPKNAAGGTTVTVTVKPNDGYVLETLTVTDKNGDELKLTDKGNGKYTFTMPGSKVEVKATFMEDNSVLNFFYDVPNDAFFYEAVKWAVKSGVTNGLTETMFGPYEPCTRAQIITFLWRAAGSPEPKTAVSFADVPAGSYYAKAVAWAIENGITNGLTETTFAPDATCTRGQGVTFLYRALKGSAGGGANFTDVKSDTFYADAVNWAVANNVTNGTSDTTFSPDDNCTRGQIVTFLYRAYQGK